MRVHVYNQGVPTALTHPDLAPTTTLGEVIELDIEERIYVVGSEDEIDINISLVEIFDEKPGHLLVHSCKEVIIDVSYLGDAGQFKVHPSAHVKKVLSDAVEILGLDHGSSVDLEFREIGSQVVLNDPSKPIGAYVPKGSCSLNLELVHVVRAQG